MPKVSDKSSKGAGKMPTTAEQARSLLIAVAGPLNLGDSVKVGLVRAATRLGIGFRRARAIYHREARLIGADEWDGIRRRAAELNIQEIWGNAQHADLAIRLREDAPRHLRSAAMVRDQDATAGDEGGRSGAGPVAR